MKKALLVLLAIGSINLVPFAEDNVKTIGSIERADPAINDLIPEDAQIEILAEGFEWSEGPVWVSEGDYVLFSDIPNNVINKWKEGEGLSEYLKPAGYTGEKERGGEPGSNGLAIDAEGNLVLCHHGDRRIAIMNAPLDDPQPEFITVAGEFEGEKFNSPNDLVIHSSGDIYFTDPPYGLEGNVNDPAKEMDYQGIFRVDTEGNVTLLSKELSRPNGIGFSPDEKTLYVANSDGSNPVWLKFPVLDDGSVGESEVFFDSRSIDRRGGGDGLKVDVDGNMFATGPGGVLVLSPEGKYLGTIRTENPTSNCAFDDEGYLYITADAYLLRVKTNTKGALN